jgi:dTDP-4-dehydrorhamnose reductase
MKAVVLGAGGQIGRDMQREMADWDLVSLRHADLDICNHSAVRNSLTKINPEVVINAAAFVRVDEAETRVEEAFSVNAFAVRNLALTCRDLNCILVHISTDYVFDGAKQSPYTEDDCPKPLNAYGASKLAGETFVQNLCPRHLIIRSSGLYGPVGQEGEGLNFVQAMLRQATQGKPIRVVNDQVVSPTYTRDVAVETKALLRAGANGLRHVANRGACTWFEFAVAIFELARLQTSLQPIASAEFGALARRPSYSALVSRYPREPGMSSMRDWREALAGYLREAGLSQASDIEAEP